MSTFSDDGSRLIAKSGSMGANLRLWDGNSGTEIAALLNHKNHELACAFSSDGSRLLSGAEDGTLRLLDTATGHEVASLTAHTAYLRDCAFSPDGSQIVLAFDDGTVEVADSLTGNQLASFPAQRTHALCCAFSPDCSWIVSGFGEGFVSGTGPLKLWDVESKEQIATLIGHTDWVWRCAFSPDGKFILSCSGDGIIKLWDKQTAQPLATIDCGTNQTCFAFSPDCRYVAYGCRDKALTVSELGTGEEICEYRTRQPVTSIAWKPKNRILTAVDEDGNIYILQPNHIALDRPVVTAWRSRACVVGCPICLSWFEMNALLLGTKISCPKCDEGLKINSFALNGNCLRMIEAGHKVGHKSE